jgi:S1-C subfamily serine protease
MNTDGILRGADIAVPTVTLERVVDAILRDGGVKRGYLGVAAQTVHLPEAERDALGQRRAALIVAVEKGSAAEKSGLVLGDVLIALGGEKITGPRSLAMALRDQVSQALEAKILRGGALETLSITTGERL